MTLIIIMAHLFYQQAPPSKYSSVVNDINKFAEETKLRKIGTTFSALIRSGRRVMVFEETSCAVNMDYCIALGFNAGDVESDNRIVFRQLSLNYNKRLNELIDTMN